ncbi:hypothetical protein M011DRAFT_153516 [Sporormia fimetaria CBS 119925]|uniref:Uncharacterized protein n=1 Tax=Sporormia fimetaria CBS 119925 TaxID=1340428 RepID=A0A6A6V2Z7_9PLEO|nr:hypothetical protein M011DRAFT_153516 [Sporormia fimetaria CBS 119925]
MNPMSILKRKHGFCVPRLPPTYDDFIRFMKQHGLRREDQSVAIIAHEPLKWDCLHKDQHDPILVYAVGELWWRLEGNLHPTRYVVVAPKHTFDVLMKNFPDAWHDGELTFGPYLPEAPASGWTGLWWEEMEEIEQNLIGKVLVLIRKKTRGLARRKQWTLTRTRP